MPATAKCVAVARDASGINVSFDDGSALQFSSLGEMAEYADTIETTENCRKFLLKRWLKADSDASDTAPILNRTCSINAGAPSPVQIG